MNATPSYPDLLELIDDRATVFRAAVSGSDLTARVPGCPDWTVHNLVTHLGKVHRFWAAAVSAGPSESPPDGAKIFGTEPVGELLDWSAESVRLLLDALRAAPADQPCWTWWESSGAPMTAGAVARHQVQETAVHAYDAQESVGKPEPLPAAVAVDGVAEFVSVGLSSLGAWPHRPARIALAAVDGPTAVVDLTPAGVTVDPAASGDPLATVHGSASDLVLFLYRRIGPEAVTVEGDRPAVDELLAWAKND